MVEKKPTKKTITTKIVMTKDYKRVCGMELKKGSEHNVYDALKKELVEDKKVAKLAKGE